MPVDLEIVHNHASPVVARLLTGATTAGSAPSPGGGPSLPSAPRPPRDRWRWPGIDTANGGGANAVTFLWDSRLAPTEDLRSGVPSLISTVSGLWQAAPMEQVADTLWAFTAVVHYGQVHRYRFIVNGRQVLDPVNPQSVTLPNGDVWSRFFTCYCTELITFDRWEARLLDRLVRHLLPFNDDEARQFEAREGADPRIRNMQRLDVSVGVVNFIDKVIAREEFHHQPTYRTGLRLIDRVLRSRNPYDDIERMPEGMFVELYTDLALSSGPDGGPLAGSGWIYADYGNPNYFFNVLRRHTWTGAFGHPKYGGNAAGLGWRYLHDRFRPIGFRWDAHQEAPLGTCGVYIG